MGKYDLLVDWNGSGWIDPVDIGISIAAAEMQEEPNSAYSERIALISCSKLKKPYKCRASELYSASTLFSLYNTFDDGTVLSVLSTAIGTIVDIEFDLAGKKKFALWAASKYMRKIER